MDEPLDMMDTSKMNFDSCDDLVDTSESESVEVEEILDCEELKPVKKNSNILLENHIACEPDFIVTMYQLHGSSRVYSDEEFSIQDVNPDRIARKYKVIQDSDTCNSDSSSRKSMNRQVENNVNQKSVKNEK